VIVRSDTTSGAVVVQGIVRHDASLQEPAHQSGIGDVVEALMPYGTQTYGRVAYQAQLDAIAANVKTGFAFSLSTLATHFDRGMHLLADDELHPSLAAADFAIVRDSHASALAGDETTPDHLAQVALAERLYPVGDPARRFPSASEVKALSVDDAKAFYLQAFRPDLTTIAIVGNVTPAVARASVEHWFGGWKATGAAPALARHATHDNAASSLVIPATGRIQDTALLRETLALGNTDPDLAPLELADTLLSGDFSSILIRDMRVTTGYVYAVGTAVRSDRERSTFNVQYACSPTTFSKAQHVLERDLAELGRRDVAAERLQRAKSRLLSELALSAASYESLAGELASDASAGLPLDDAFRRAQREFAASADDVRTAVARWIRPRGFVRVVEGPTPK
jgi:zinc protease